MRIILHAGMCKTATTSIQETLIQKENFLLLEKLGYITVPNDTEDMITLGMLLSDSNYWVNYRTAWHKTREDIDEKRELIFRQLKEGGLKGKDIIISHELLCLLTEEELQKFKNSFNDLPFQIEFTVVLCTREKIALSASMIQQLIKTGDVDGNCIEDFTSYSKLLGKLTNVFGRESLMLYPFEDAIRNGVVETFFRKIGLPDEEIGKLELFRTNESVSQFSTELLAFLQLKVPKLIDGKLNKKRLYYLDDIILKIPGTKFNVDLKTAKDIYESNVDDILWLKNNFGIDYTNPDLSNYPDEVRLELTESQFFEITETYTSLNFFEREIILEFLKQKASTVNENTFDLLADRLKSIVVDPFEMQSITGNRIALWGAGDNAEFALDVCKSKELIPRFFIDSDLTKSGTDIDGVKVISPQTFFYDYSGKYTVFVTVRDSTVYNEIKKQLLDNGVEEVYRLAPRCL